MILGHPNSVFSGQGEREVTLVESAENFVREFELLIKIILSGRNSSRSLKKLSSHFLSHNGDSGSTESPNRHTFRSHLAAFDTAWRAYIYNFVVWKIKDARSLEEDLVRAACQLELSMMQKCKLTAQRETSDLSHDMRVIQMQSKRRRAIAFSEKHLPGGAGYVDSASQNQNLSFTDAGLSCLASSCPQLEKLSLIWCSHISYLGLISIAETCKMLKTLDLQGCYVQDRGLIAIGQHCKQLEDLNLRFCEGLTDEALIGIARGCGKSLKSLGVAACAWITDNSLKNVASHCTQLEILSLDSEVVKNEGVISVAKSCLSLKVLKLQCIKLSDDALQAVGSFCSSLETLALRSFQKFTDRSLLAIGMGCKKLHSLTLNDCYFLSDKSLEVLASGCKKLTRLEINGCHNIGTSGVESIGRSCSSLTELALLYCQRIGNNALREVARGCPLLQALDLVDCSGIDDDAICNIAQGCRNLRKLHIRRCYEIGNRGVIAVGENCKFLTDLNLRFCDRTWWTWHL